jgi:hypothetical protein
MKGQLCAGTEKKLGRKQLMPIPIAFYSNFTVKFNFISDNKRYISYWSRMMERKKHWQVPFTIIFCIQTYGSKMFLLKASLYVHR